MGDKVEPIRTPSGNQRCMASPMMRPNAAPILKIRIRLPDGTGRVEAKTVKKNCKNDFKFCSFFELVKKWNGIFTDVR